MDVFEQMEHGNADCLAKRQADEPMFIILGRDPDAAHVVRYWAERRHEAGDPDHARKAFAVAELMDAYGGKPVSAPPADAYTTRPADSEARSLLERAQHFAGHASTFDWNEDRCIMTAVHLAGDIRAYLTRTADQ